MLLKGLIISVVCLQISQATFLGFIDEEVKRHEMDSDDIADIIIDAGETIELTCAATELESIAWEYPRLLQDNNTVTEVSLHTVNSDGEEITPYYTSKLVISNVTHKDSGDYRCYCNAMDDIGHLYEKHLGHKLITERTVYVYVPNVDNLFVEPGTEMELVSGVTRGSAVLPCAVTSPNITVQLLREQGNARLVEIAMDGNKYQYDYRLGFTISVLALQDHGAYRCKAMIADLEQTKTFLLHVMRSYRTAQPLLQQPVLRGSESITKGMTSSFKCNVAAGKDQITSVSWWKLVGEAPKQIVSDERVVVEDLRLSTSLCSGNRTMCSFRRQLRRDLESAADDDLYVKYTGRLKIHNAQPEDSAKYYCQARSSGLMKKSNIIDFEVVPTVIIAGDEDTKSMPTYVVEIN